MNKNDGKYPGPFLRVRRFSGGFGLWSWIVVIVVLAVAGGGGWLLFRKKSVGKIDLKTAARCRVEQGEMVISILQTGELESKRSVKILNETEQDSKIVEIVADGALVKKGDLLVQLESRQLEDQHLKDKSGLSTAEAEVRQAAEELEIKKFKFNTDLDSTQLKADLAKMDLNKYIVAEYPQKVLKAESDIKLAEEELKRAEIKLDWTKKLLEKGYANKQELDTNALEVARKTIDVQNKKEDLRILRDFSYSQDLRKKENDLKDALAEVERLRRTYDAERSRDEAKLEASKTELEIAKNRLKKTEDQLSKTHIVSDFDGQVFYPKPRGPWDTRKIEKGAQLHERQQILEFPDLAAWNIRTGVPESIIDKIKLEQNALATIDALPGEILKSKVAKVSAVPDTEGWLSTGVKTYTVTLDVLTTPSGQLKPGMSVMVEIITGTLQDVVYAPIQAITSQGENHFVYAIKGDKIDKTPVVTGENNENFIQIVDGAKPGQELLLYAPVEQETNAGLKKRPLDESKKNGSPEEKGPEKKSADAAKETDKKEATAAAVAPPAAEQKK